MLYISFNSSNSIQRKAANLKQSSGYVSQSVKHLNLCQVIHPIGGVRPTPLSSPSESLTIANAIDKRKLKRENMCS